MPPGYGHQLGIYFGGCSIVFDFLVLVYLRETLTTVILYKGITEVNVGGLFESVYILHGMKRY